MFSIARTLVAGVLAFVAATVAVYHLTMWLDPPRTSDGRPLMALGHAFMAMMAGIAVAIAAMIADRIWQRRSKDRFWEEQLRIATSSEPAPPGSPER